MLEINKIYNMECIEGMRQLEDNSVDSIVTDPPYELGFMGRGWDRTGIAYNVEMWEECLRVLKPGGYILAFGGSRTYHRMACAIEDAGFVIHPLIGWITGQGFPKATNLSKQLDKQAGAVREVIGHKVDISTGKPMSAKQAKAGSGMNLHDGYDRPRRKDKEHCNNMTLLTASTTLEAQQWDGWYYGLQSLKPALEPCCMAQKPIDGKRMTDNVVKWGTGAVNIDGCRVGVSVGGWGGNPSIGYSGYKSGKPRPVIGRFPANIIFDKEAGKLLDEQSGISVSKKSMRGVGFTDSNIYGDGDKKFDTKRGHNDSGGASRYFKSIEYTENDFLPFYYCAKASKKERGEGNLHPTVKPLSLIKYLLKLVTPPNGLSLDPFMGSGTHALACIESGFNYIGFELGKDYCDIAEKRIANKREEIAKIKEKGMEERKKEGIQDKLF